MGVDELEGALPEISMRSTALLQPVKDSRDFSQVAPSESDWETCGRINANPAPAARRQAPRCFISALCTARNVCDIMRP